MLNKRHGYTTALGIVLAGREPEIPLNSSSHTWNTFSAVSVFVWVSQTLIFYYLFYYSNFSRFLHGKSAKLCTDTFYAEARLGRLG